MKRSFKTFPISSNAFVLTVLASLFTAFPAAAADDVISIELNKAEETEQGCRSFFVFDNRSGHQLSKFQVEVVLFDDKGVYLRQILLDMAPLYKDKKVVASFLLNELACDEIGSMLVNALPSCVSNTDVDLDCLTLLEVTSRSSIPLEK